MGSNARGVSQCFSRVTGTLRLAGTWISSRQRSWHWGAPAFVLTRADEERGGGGVPVEKVWLMCCQRVGRSSQPCGAGRDNACPLSVAPAGVQSRGLRPLALILRPSIPAMQPSAAALPSCYESALALFPAPLGSKFGWAVPVLQRGLPK